jgi:RNA polymerase sigma factor (TIGR02999 family)
MSVPVEITQVLRSVSRGESPASLLFPLVYEEVRALAGIHLKNERSDHTLQATALVHEAYMRLVDITDMTWKDRAHFMAVASQAIRRVLIDHARSRSRKKRGGGVTPVSLDDVATIPVLGPADDLIALDDALTLFAEKHEDMARVVELRFFGGLSIEEIAGVLGVHKRTVDRHWLFAKTWLYRELTTDTPADGIQDVD